MDEQKSEQNVSTASANVVTTSTTSSHIIYSKQHIVQNYLLIWMDTSIDDSKQDCQNTLAQLRNVVNNVKIFTQRDEGVDFLTEFDDMKAFLILEGTLGSQIVPLIHDIPQLHGIYIYCGNKSSHEQWTRGWTKIKGTHTKMKSICEALQLAVKQYNHDYIAMSFFTATEETSNANLNQLEPCFMYTQIFKEILLEMEHNEQSIKYLVAYWRQLYNNNTAQLNIIRQFEQDYRPELAIWWYSRHNFTYEMLNHALRTLKGDIIINMGFFIHDLHRQIEQLHQKQVNEYHEKPFIVYRGQGLLKTDFKKLLQTKNGLLSFNNFLSTTKDRVVSHMFAESALENTDMVGIFFKMTIDSSVSSIPFACIREFSNIPDEEEILFSMHSVFRIDKITQLDENILLYQVDLQLTADDDQELRILTNRIKEEVKGETGWKRLGRLLLNIKQLNKAEELYTTLLEETSDEHDKASYYHQLGYVKDHQGDYEKAIEYYEKAREICEKIFPSYHPVLGTSYNNIASVYGQMGEYSKAVSFYEKAFQIFVEILPANHLNLASIYNNMGSMYEHMAVYSKALLFYEKTLAIRRNALPPNHPDLASCYNSIGNVYNLMGHYLKAVALYEKALEIKQKTLPPYHPDLAIGYNSIGAVYDRMGQYSKALSFYDETLEILKKALPLDHPDFAAVYSNIGNMYHQTGEHSKALANYEKALQILKKTCFSNHPILAASYNNIGELHRQMGDYSKALSSYEKALEIKLKNLPPDSSHLATSYNNIGNVFNEMGQYSNALPFYEKGLEIIERTLPSDHPHLASAYNNIGSMYQRLGEYSKALSFHEKDLKISEKILSPNHPDLAASYNNIAALYQEIGEYSKALPLLEKSLEMIKTTLPPNHPFLGVSYNNIAFVCGNMEEYSKALAYYERALNIMQHSLPSNHRDAETTRRNIERLKEKILRRAFQNYLD